jgi:predicted short-subunit dehydrogenase-like oxidoreductase (DUF2520 family)
VASHLAMALKDAGFDIRQVLSEKFSHADALAKKTGAKAIHSFSELDLEVNLCLVAVPDDSIEDVVKPFRQAKGIVAHTSGISPLSVLNSIPNHGVFYPLQTFSKKRKLNISKVPFCIEASSNKVNDHLRKVALKLSSHVYKMSSEQRQYLHLTAVFVNNYSNHLFQVAFDLLNEKEMDHRLLIPLIEETVAKIKALHPKDAQTGPARRNDFETINKHLMLLNDFPDYKELYQIFARQLKKKYNEQL